MPEKVALVTGVTGQDGTYLAALLSGKGYRVHGMTRRISLPRAGGADLHAGGHEKSPAGGLHHGDLTDSTNLIRIIGDIQPDEIYNLAAQSHVSMSFKTPEYTANADGLGTLRLLEAVRLLGLKDKVRFYQASTSEMFGKAREPTQRETSLFHPRSPYGAAKLYAYWITVNYREAYGIHASNGILFNHESPIRGENYVSRKITRTVAAIHHGLIDCLHLGNLDSTRDWGHARDYVEGMWLMLQQPRPDDYVLATGEVHSVREFADKAFAHAGVTLEWQGKGVEETARDVQNGRVLVRVDPCYFRPAEVEILQGDASKARDKLGWTPQVTFDALVKEMVENDLRATKPAQV